MKDYSEFWPPKHVENKARQYYLIGDYISRLYKERKKVTTIQDYQAATKQLNKLFALEESLEQELTPEQLVNA